jgi:hypothetical protein
MERERLGEHPPQPESLWSDRVGAPEPIRAEELGTVLSEKPFSHEDHHEGYDRVVPEDEEDEEEGLLEWVCGGYAGRELGCRG